ncbi:MAG TPA: hypothetical protein VHP58_03945 [Alphaproteobacteria bacterium]|nr:hypothetical protein [Alphaproteobacteria bacterium]
MFFAVLIALAYAIFSAGRLLAVRQPLRRENFTLATAWCAGYGAFLLWWLAAQPLLGAGSWVTPAAFVFATGVLAGALYQQWHHWPREQHHNAHIIISLLIGAPLLAALWQVFPQGEFFWQQAAAAAALGQLGAWPTPAQLPAALLPAVPGLMPLLTPLAALGHIAQPPVLPLLVNLGCLLAAGGALLVALNWPVRWSNLPLVAAGGLAVVAVANPWMPYIEVLNAQSQVPAALALLVAVLPLLNPMPLAGGATALGPALSLVTLTLLHPLGWLLSLWVAVVYKVRMLAEGVVSPDHARRHALALTLLATLPTLAWCGWQIALQPFNADIVHLLLSPQTFAAALLAQVPAAASGSHATFMLQSCIIGASLLAGLKPILGRSATSTRHLSTTYAPFFVPVMLLVPPLVLVAVLSPQKAKNLLEVQQFVWLVPLAAWAAQRYRHSAWRGRLFGAPWGYGSVFCILLFSLMLFASKPAPGTPAPWASVAADLRAYPLVLTSGLPPAAINEMSYHSNGYTHIWPIPDNQKAASMALLHQNAVPLLTSANALPSLGITAQAPAPLLLFQPEANGVRLLNKWNVTP